MEYILLLAAYLIGSIPFSYIFGKIFKNRDLRKHGSGNLGTTNAFRVLGNAIGILTLVLDVLKSGLLVLLVRQNPNLFGATMLHEIFYGFAAVIGHVFPIWLKFKGGKGVASSLGILIVYAPWVGVTLIPIFLFTTGVTKYVSLGSTTSALAASLISIILYFNVPQGSIYDIQFMLVTIAATSLIFVKHRNNFIKIFNGTENRANLFKFKKEK